MMKNTKATQGLVWWLFMPVLVACFGYGAPGNAGELGHYAPTLADIRDYLMPAEPTLAFKEYNYFYNAGTFKNGNGDSVNSVTLKNGTTVNIDVNLNLFITAPAVVWVSPWKVLGAHYGAYAVVPFSNTSVGAVLATETGHGLNANTSNYGLNDIFVQPIWFGWNLPNWDFDIGYGFSAPTGRFSAGANDNIGLGFWSQQFQGTVAWYPNPNRGTALISTLTYEFNSKVQGEDLTPGSHLSLNLGASQYLPLGSNFLAEVGVEAYGQWQVTDDSGADANTNQGKDQILGIGPQIGITYLPWKAQATFKWLHEVEAQDRFEGDNFTLNFGVAF